MYKIEIRDVDWYKRQSKDLKQIKLEMRLMHPVGLAKIEKQIQLLEKLSHLVFTLSAGFLELHILASKPLPVYKKHAYTDLLISRTFSAYRNEDKEPGIPIDIRDELKYMQMSGRGKRESAPSVFIDLGKTAINFK